MKLQEAVAWIFDVLKLLDSNIELVKAKMNFFWM